MTSSAVSGAAAGNIQEHGSRLSIQGDWVLEHYPHLESLVQKKLDNGSTGSYAVDQVDLTALGKLDTAGASLLFEYLGADTLSQLADQKNNVPVEKSALLHVVIRAMADRTPPETDTTPPVRRFLEETGVRVENIAQMLWLLMGFIGQILSAISSIALRPKRWRVTPFVASIQDIGLNALPIVTLLTFLVGAVVAFLGATVLKDFGATIYTVNLVAFSFLREFGVLLAAILLAGRTASAFTAQIGSMKVNEELDAIRTLGLDPIDLLVVPRVLAMIVSLPILTFAGMFAGMAGGAMVSALSLDISLAQFFAIVERDITVSHFLVGMSKAPVFAFLIAAIGCQEGFKVGGSAQSVGAHTTSAVVQSIFMVILLDAVAALFFMEMGW